MNTPFYRWSNKSFLQTDRICKMVTYLSRSLRLYSFFTSHFWTQWFLMKCCSKVVELNNVVVHISSASTTLPHLVALVIQRLLPLIRRNFTPTSECAKDKSGLLALRKVKQIKTKQRRRRRGREWEGAAVIFEKNHRRDTLNKRKTTTATDPSAECPMLSVVGIVPSVQSLDR